MFIGWQPGSLEEQIFRRRKRGVVKSLHTSLQLAVSGLCTPQPLRLPGMDAGPQARHSSGAIACVPSIRASVSADRPQAESGGPPALAWEQVLSFPSRGSPGGGRSGGGESYLGLPGCAQYPGPLPRSWVLSLARGTDSAARPPKLLSPVPPASWDIPWAPRAPEETLGKPEVPGAGEGLV